MSRALLPVLLLGGALLALLVQCDAQPSAAAGHGSSPREGSRLATPVGKEVTFNGETVDLPEGFLIGAGTSAMQIEGAPDEEGRSKSVLDVIFEPLANQPADYTGMRPAGMAADSYHRYKDDVRMAKELKLQVYRFSVSWSRVLPEGDASKPNKAGVDYYHNLIDELVANGIQPMITMNHFDYPLSVLKKTGGWADKRIVDSFVEYADFLFRTYGNKVTLWTTVNEPNYYCMNFALLEVPDLYKPQPGDDYKCVHHTILCHMRAYRLYEEKYKSTQGGKIGAAALTLWCKPNSTSYEDIQAAERANLFALGAIYHPVVHGDYPQALIERVGMYSKQEGLAKSRLPEFTAEEKAKLKGSSDFLCFNAYMGTTVADGRHAERPKYGDMKSDRDAIEVGTDTRPGHFGDLFMKANPWVLREAPMWIRDNYNMPIFITENGWGDQTNDPLNDTPRVGYHSEYLYELIRTVKEEKVDIIGYLVWSLIDSYEFSANYGRKFGLAHVDYEGGTLKRSLKASSWFFKYIGEHRKVPKVAFKLKSSGAGQSFGGPILAPAILLAIFSALRFI